MHDEELGKYASNTKTRILTVVFALWLMTTCTVPMMHLCLTERSFIVSRPKARNTLPSNTHSIPTKIHSVVILRLILYQAIQQ